METAQSNPRSQPAENGTAPARKKLRRRASKEPVKPQFVLDSGQLMGNEYSSLQDKHLAGFWDHPRIRRHLVHMRLVRWASEPG